MPVHSYPLEIYLTEETPVTKKWGVCVRMESPHCKLWDHMDMENRSGTLLICWFMTVF